MIERLRAKAKPWRDARVAHVNSTFYGGGVAELLSSLTLLLSDAGLVTEWRAILGRPDYFNVTKKMHNALQSADINVTDLKMEIYEQVAYENSVRNILDHDFVVIHDPQPLPLVCHYKKHGPWIWRCHLDLSNPNRELWQYLKPFIERYDAVVLSLPEYRQELETPEIFFPPTIDPFTTKNKELSEDGNRRTPRALQNSDRPAVGRADLEVRPLERSRRRDRGVQAGPAGSGLHPRAVGRCCNRRPGRRGGLPIVARCSGGTDHHLERAGFRPGQCASAPCPGSITEIDP